MKRLQNLKFPFAILTLFLLIIFSCLTIYAYLLPSSKQIYHELANSSCNYVQYALIGNMIINPLIIFALLPISIAYYRNISGNSLFMTVYLVLFAIPIIWILTISGDCSDIINANILGKVVFFQCLIGSFYILGAFFMGFFLIVYRLCYGVSYFSDNANDQITEDIKEVLV